MYFREKMLGADPIPGKLQHFITLTPCREASPRSVSNHLITSSTERVPKPEPADCERQRNAVQEAARGSLLGLRSLSRCAHTPPGRPTFSTVSGPVTCTREGACHVQTSKQAERGPCATAESASEHWWRLPRAAELPLSFSTACTAPLSFSHALLTQISMIRGQSHHHNSAGPVQGLQSQPCAHTADLIRCPCRGPTLVQNTQGG